MWFGNGTSFVLTLENFHGKKIKNDSFTQLRKLTQNLKRNLKNDAIYVFVLHLNAFNCDFFRAETLLLQLIKFHFEILMKHLTTKHLWSINVIQSCCETSNNLFTLVFFRFNNIHLWGNLEAKHLNMQNFKQNVFKMESGAGFFHPC